ncbi:MAG: ammonium transporter [Alphaproteobacteria bacterium]|nr:ammonium transporter [Alphaproteobacteria bacterium]
MTRNEFSNKYQSKIPFIVLLLFIIVSFFIHQKTFLISEQYPTDKVDMVFMFICAALVFLMTPGLAFFYGGMVDKKNILSTMLKSFACIGIVTLMWLFFGFSLTFGNSLFGIIGNPKTFFLYQSVSNGLPILQGGKPMTISLMAFSIFQLMFAIITPSLVVGAVAERIKFTAFILFIILFSIFVYAPIAHSTWHPMGIFYQMGVLDFAGGAPVHISAGCAALAGAIVLKQRKIKLENTTTTPASHSFVLIGTSLLWFGWFGFNSGSALKMNAIAINAFLTTNVSAASAGVTWMIFDVFIGKKPTILGFCLGAVVGLVAITPSAGYVSIHHAVIIGFIAAIISNILCKYFKTSKVDDCLDVFPCHGIGGITGMLLTGIFCSQNVNPDIKNGLLWGNWNVFYIQFKALIFIAGYSFIISFLIFKLINFLYSIRVSDSEERIGLDITQHEESDF